VWQALQDELAGHGFTVIAVAMDSREGDPLPWIEAAKPSYPTLIDREHRLAELYGIVNVPQAVWIDEAGRIVRPAEPAGAYEGFRRMNRATRELPEDVARLTAEAKAIYLDAIRDWARHGARSAHAFSAEQARAHLPAMTEDAATAQAMFRLAQLLFRRGEREEADRFIREASRLHPDSWCIWRQGAGVTELGLAAQPDFWARVDALGPKRYYAPVDMPGMP
jgi:tetratricopeptide (TPR) repeat protein